MNIRARKLIIASALVIAGIFLICPCIFCSYAETIYFKNGDKVKGEIAYFKAGTIWFDRESGLFGIAMGDIDKIENDDGTISKYDFKSLYRGALRHAQEKNYIKAVELYDILLETFDDNKELHYLRGFLNHKLGNIEEAAGDYLFLIGHDSADTQILNNLGVIHAGRKEYQEAEKLFKSAIEKDPRLTEPYRNLAKLFLEMSDYISAKTYWEKVSGFNPDDKEAKTNLEYIEQVIIEGKVKASQK